MNYCRIAGSLPPYADPFVVVKTGSPRAYSKFTHEQIAFALKQGELDISVECVARSVSATLPFYKWRQKYAGIGPSALRRLRQL